VLTASLDEVNRQRCALAMENAKLKRQLETQKIFCAQLMNNSDDSVEGKRQRLMTFMQCYQQLKAAFGIDEHVMIDVLGVQVPLIEEENQRTFIPIEGIDVHGRASHQ